jgi:hypothetical protein
LSKSPTDPLGSVALVKKQERLEESDAACAPEAENRCWIAEPALVSQIDPSAPWKNSNMEPTREG